MVFKTKEANRTSPPGNMIWIDIFYQIIMILGDSVLLGGSKPGDKLLYIYGMDSKFVEFRSGEDFIFYDRHECWVELVMRNIELLCWHFLGGKGKDLGTPLRYIYLILCGGGRQYAHILLQKLIFLILTPNTIRQSMRKGEYPTRFVISMAKLPPLSPISDTLG